jgi:Uma2 family endonuclease
LNIIVNTNQHSFALPGWVNDHASFRRWAKSDLFPDKGRFGFFNGDVWVDTEMEMLLAHNQVKHEISLVLGMLVRDGDLGYFCPDRMLLSNVETGLSTEPDGMFVSYDALNRGRAVLVPGVGEDFSEVEGAPDWVLEVVSRASVEKDTETLPDLYRRSGIREYWLVDARSDREAPSLQVLRLTKRGYVRAPVAGGFQRSAVFGRSFRLVTGRDRLGHPRYRLEVAAPPASPARPKRRTKK